MKHQHILACICIGMTYLSSCQSENLTSFPQTEQLPIAIVARIGNLPTINGRYAGEDLNHVDFTTGDAIGIFMNEDPIVRWDYLSMTWTAQSYMYWTDKTTPHSFKAFYPYKDANSYEAIPMPNLQNQSGDITSISHYDFLATSVTQSYENQGIVSFQGEGKSFKHISSLVSLTIKANEDLSDATIKSISLYGNNLFAPSVYSFNEGVKLSPDEFSDELKVNTNHSMEGKDQTYYLIVNEKLNELDPVILAIEYEKEGSTYMAQKDNFANNIFRGGMNQHFTLTIKNNVLTISNAQIESWINGQEMDDIIINAKEKQP